MLFVLQTDLKILNEEKAKKSDIIKIGILEHDIWQKGERKLRFMPKRET